jgi:cyclic pyranopterin phosphate synthase
MVRPPYLHALDEADETLQLLPYAARRALDREGWTISLDGWKSLTRDVRERIALAGTNPNVGSLDPLLGYDGSPAKRAEAWCEPGIESLPEWLLVALPGPLSHARWASLSLLDRYILAKRAKKGDEARIAEAYRVIVEGTAGRPTHVDEHGDARMVSIAEKDVTERRAVASARIRMKAATQKAIRELSTKKGDVLATAKIAGIMAAKKTHELIPLCHQIALTHVNVTFDFDGDEGIVVRAVAEATDRTGVEMEAMTAASTAALTIYDMVKSIDRWMTIEAVQLEEKSGGRSGSLVR